MQNELMEQCRQMAVKCLLPFRADEQAVHNASVIIYDFVISQLSQPSATQGVK